MILQRGQENTTTNLNWFITLNSVLTNANTIGFRIFDPGDVQVFPTSGFESVVNAPGRFATGSYFAFDNTTGLGWTPLLTFSLGEYKIEWQWQVSSSLVQTGCENFTLLSEDAPLPSPTYCSVADVRAEGITAAQAIDAEIQSQLELWQAFLERACRQWFESRALVLDIDGTDSDTLHFGVPIISISDLKINRSQTSLVTSLFEVYAARDYPDDRRNPRIKLRGPFEDRDIFLAPINHGEKLKFRKGRRNQHIEGNFGFVEEDGLRPKLIARALCKLVVEKILNPIIPDGSVTFFPSGPVGPVIEEKTDGHSQKFANLIGTVSERRPGLTGITTDQEILDIIKLYRAPIGAATPANWTFD